MLEKAFCMLLKACSQWADVGIGGVDTHAILASPSSGAAMRALHITQPCRQSTIPSAHFQDPSPSHRKVESCCPEGAKLEAVRGAGRVCGGEGKGVRGAGKGVWGAKEGCEGCREGCVGCKEENEGCMEGCEGCKEECEGKEAKRALTANMGGPSLRHCLRTREKYPSAPMRTLARTEGWPRSKCTVTPSSSSSCFVICNTG